MGIQVGDEEGDCPMWRWNKYGHFTVSSTYKHFIDGGCRSNHASSIWSTKCPLNLRVFLWLISKNVILMWDNLLNVG